MPSIYFLFFMDGSFLDSSIAIGREGGVAPLIALAKSDAQVSFINFLLILWFLESRFSVFYLLFWS